MIGLHADDGLPLGPHGPLAGAQADAVERRSGSLIVSANAGSGKTTVLTERYVHCVLVDEVPAAQILAITFTDKAAGELRARIRSRLVALGAREHVRALDRGWISTFHGTCARILRAHAVQAGVDPRFVVLDDAETRALQAAAFEQALAAVVDAADLAAIDVAAAYGVDRLSDMVLELYAELRSRGQSAPRVPGLAAGPPPVPDAVPLVGATIAARQALDGVSGKTVDKARAALDATEALLRDLPPGTMPPLKLLAQTAYKPGSTKALADGAPAAARERHAAYLAACHAIAEHGVLVVIDRLLVAYDEAFTTAKQVRGGLDYDDLQLRARDLLRDVPAIRQRLQARFRSIMVDEFQDTNQVQLELLDLLGEHRFVVGDTLQSIYGFRHADVGIFRAERARRQANDAAIALAENYRTRPEILAAIDLAFAPGHGEDHVPFAPQRAPGGGSPLVELVLVDRDAVQDWPEDGDDPLGGGARWRRAEARALAQRIRGLLDDGVPAHDIVVLLRSLTDLHVYEGALDEQGVRTLAAAGRGYWGRTHVLDLCAYLGLLANPGDELALFGVLASPLVGLSSDALAIISNETRRDRRWEGLTAGPLPADLPAADRVRLERFLAWLPRERREAAGHALAGLIERVVTETGYDRYVLGLAGGERRWANVRKLMRLAEEYEARHGRDLRGFVDRATSEVEAGDRESDAPVTDADGSAVRMMSIHAAKGLEFSIVVVADIGHQRAAERSDLIVTGSEAALRLRTVDGYNEKSERLDALRADRREADLAEERRVFHVAMTRAEERLILSGPVAARPDTQAPSGWLLDGLVPDLPAALEEEPEGDLTFTLTAAGAEGGPPVAVSVVRDPIVAAAPQPRTLPPVTPPQPEPQETRAGQLTLDFAAAAPPSAPLPLADAQPIRPAVSYSSLAFFARCAYRFHLERECSLPENDTDPLLVWPAAADAPLIDPRLRGNLVHLALERLDLRTQAVPDLTQLKQLAAELTDEALPDAALEDAQRLVRAAVDAPLMAPVWQTDRVLREQQFAVAVAGDDAPLLYGFLDLIAEGADGHTLVVDYKTDRVREDDDLEQKVERSYLLQRQSYALAMLAAGAQTVDIAHLYLERPEVPVVARFSQTDRPALQAAIAERCAELALPQRPVTGFPGRFTCAGCPGRGGLCSYSEEETAR